MQIVIKNTGPISSFEIDIDKQFNLLIGDNNIGKSYSITLTYCIIKNILEMKEFSNVFSFVMEFGTALNEDEDFVELTKYSGKSKDITTLVNKYTKIFFQETLIRSIEDSFKGAFTSLKHLKNESIKMNPSFSIVTEEASLHFDIMDDALIFKGFEHNEKVVLRGFKHSKEPRKKGDLNHYFSFDDENISSTFSKGEQFMMQTILPQVVGFLSHSLNDVAAIHYLPASRSGLYQALSAFGQIVAELSKKRAYLTQKIELPGISEPVSDYFIKLSQLVASKKEITNKKVDSIAKRIESELLNGEVIFNNKTKQLMFKPHGTNLSLELSSTSSMVSEIAPIVTYLRYILSKPVENNHPLMSLTNKLKKSKKSINKQIVIIEEPEAHLHPDIQVKLTAIFEAIIENDVSMIITSHSNFIFNKINNIIISNTVTGKKSGFNEKSVRALLFSKTENGAIVTTPEIDELGIEDDNFTDVTDVLLTEKLDLFQLHNDIQDKKSS